MNSLDLQYINLLRQIRDKGIWEDNRTGIPAKAIVGAIIQHDMSEGFPLLCCKRHSFKNIAVELEFFIRGLSDKRWLKDRGCHIWDEWANPQKVKYGTDEESKLAMATESDLGRIYGVQWRNFRGLDNTDIDYVQDVLIKKDQLVELLALLRRDPTSRRAIVTAWNPCELDQMALPPCHVMWQAMILGEKLHLTWYQRSVDTPLGLPYNIASYGLLLHLLARELGVEEGTLTGMLNNVHYYKNQEEAVNEIIERGEEMLVDIQTLPTINTNSNCGIGPILNMANMPHPYEEWTYQESSIQDYDPLPAIKIPIAV
jgi:thymidylate synthase